jgi:hypothetical protein
MIRDIQKISEIEKLYGYRIPHIEHYKYYLELLSRNDEKVITNINNLAEYEQRCDYDVKSAKYKVGDYLIKHFTELFGKYNSKPEQVSLQEKECIYLDGHRYVSIDISEANFTVAKKYHGLDLPKWERYLTENLGIDISLASSKNFRQYVLGYVLGKKINTYQKVEVFNKLKTIDNSLVVGVNCDEIVLDITNNPDFDYETLNDGYWKATVFTMNTVTNFGEHIYVKTDISGKKKLYATNGNDFYIHYKTLVLNEPLNVLDTILKQDGLYFERVVTYDNKLRKREYQYVDKNVSLEKVGTNYINPNTNEVLYSDLLDDEVLSLIEHKIIDGLKQNYQNVLEYHINFLNRLLK